jgi:opacity protein-like surface antigen
MKKQFWLIIINLLIFSSRVEAGSIDGAKTQGFGKYSLGLETEFMFEKDLTYDKGLTLANGEAVVDEKIKHLYRLLAKYNFGFWENLDIYVKLGATNFEADYAVSNSSGSKVREYNMDGEDDFVWGFGAKGTYEFTKGWLIGADVQFIRHRNKDTNTSNYLATNLETNTSEKTTFLEWHAASYLAKEFENLTPYFGVRYSDMRMKVKSETSSYKLKAKDNFGVIAGIGYKITDNWCLNLEGRFIDETAASFSGAYKF